jgi:hypothetical protein
MSFNATPYQQAIRGAIKRHASAALNLHLVVILLFAAV